MKAQVPYWKVDGQVDCCASQEKNYTYNPYFTSTCKHSDSGKQIGNLLTS